MLSVNSRIKIPLNEFDFSFARSGGPGGQHVNKANTKATLRWNVEKSPSISDAVRGRFMKKYHRRVTNEGELVLSSQRYRDQGRNVADCLSKLREMILEVATAPKKRKPTKPSRAAKERRIKEKKQTAEKKQRRKPVRRDE